MSAKHCIRCDERLDREATRCHACNSNAPEDSIKMIKWGAGTILVSGAGLWLLLRYLSSH